MGSYTLHLSLPLGEHTSLNFFFHLSRRVTYFEYATRNSKLQSVVIYDDENDDYPYSPSQKPSKPPHASTIRRPSQIVKYNV